MPSSNQFPSLSSASAPTPSRAAPRFVLSRQTTNAALALALTALLVLLMSTPALAEVVGPAKNLSTNGKDTGSSVLGMVLGVIAGFMLIKALISRKFTDAATTLVLASIAGWAIYDPKGAIDAVKGISSGMFS